ncbi:MAG: malonyl-CoA decarboxylase N-terminal domain-containing protein, partial [Comamonas sp.]
MGWAADWIEQTKLWARGAEGDKGDALHRPLALRLEATLRRGQESLSPRELRRLLQDMQQVADASLSDVEGGRYAQVLMDWYAKAELPARKDFWLLAIEKFGPDAKALQAARDRYDKASSDVERSEAEMALRRALISSRTRLLQRFAQPQGGMRFLVNMRADLLALPKAEQRYVALDAELEHLFSSWFDVALLE